MREDIMGADDTTVLPSITTHSLSCMKISDIQSVCGDYVAGITDLLLPTSELTEKALKAQVRVKFGDIFGNEDSVLFVAVKHQKIIGLVQAHRVRSLTDVGRVLIDHPVISSEPVDENVELRLLTGVVKHALRTWVGIEVFETVPLSLVAEAHLRQLIGGSKTHMFRHQYSRS